MTTLSQFWETLKTDALNLWQTVKADVTAEAVKFEPIVEADLVLVLSQLKTVALNTIMALATAEFQNLTGTQKNTITVNTIVQSAVASGKTIALQDAQLLAQQSYNALATAVSSAK